jgi:hypothetical protein
MKKLFLLLILIIPISGYLKAQQKGNPDTAKKAHVYTPDITTKHEVTIKGVTLTQINNYLTFEQYGPNLDSSDKLSGAQITAIKKDALIVIQEISKQFGDLLAEDKKKWDKEHK